MLFHLASLFQGIFGPFRLLQSYLVLIIVALYAGFIFTVLLLPRFYRYLPKDRGREFAIHAENALGKPTGAGIVFISIFFILSFLISPVNLSQITVLFFTWLVMFTGYLDDRAHHSWGEYRKGAIDLVLSVAASVALLYC
ncbi:MAG TPA: phospho-N-acetylmuramoyl-pentapeptide-transferase, partial [Treponemataceae bacterium]|nr:phospho-N-acetylmuramoyl-pentapeptide-transferase [Treponemataceae bacterium]